MILDCKSKQLSFHKNNQDLGVAYASIQCEKNVEYKMAIYMYYVNTEIELLEFKFQPN